ncbi:MAG: hypothetical protein JWO95_2810 [Verrucomicrobiales bacterium]|nr:hypothetical protein [Verrucomicrobiales bacterium]
MKKSLPYEVAATLLALFGAFLLVGALMPLINPGQTKGETHAELPSLGYYIVATPIPLLVLIASWYCNKKARTIKQQSEQSLDVPQPAWQRRLRWILSAIVIVFVLYAFLW